MAFIGWTSHDGRDVPVWDRIDDVPTWYLDNGRPIGIRKDNIPFDDLSPGVGHGVSNPLPAWVVAVLAIVKWILITLTFLFIYLTAVAIMQPYLPQKLPDGRCVSLRGCIYCPDDTGNYRPADPACVPVDPLGSIGGAITAVAVVGVVAVGAYAAYKLIGHESRKSDTKSSDRRASS